MPDYEKLGLFYLGRTVDSDKKAKADYLLYDSRDLVTHAVCVGMTGSGKTGLCIDLLEEAAIDGVPALVIDPKGDLGNLLLTFPNLSRGRLPPVDRRRRGAAERQVAGRVGRGAGRRCGRRASRAGTRTASASSGCARRPTSRSTRRASQSGLPLSIIKSFAAPPAGLHRRSGPDARARRDDGDEPAGAAGHRRGSDQEPRAHPALHAHRRRVAQGPGPRSRRADPADPEAARRSASA